MHETARVAFDFIAAHPEGVMGKEIAVHVGCSAEHFRRSIAPQLKARGVRNFGWGYLPPVNILT